MLKRTFVIGILTVIVSSLVILYDSKAGTAVGGSAEDPLVTKSYIDLRLQSIQTQVDALIAKTGTNPATGTSQGLDMKQVYDEIDRYIAGKLADVGSGQTSTNPTSNASYQVIKLEKGDSLIGEASTEMILRSGNAVGIGNAAGDGLSDITVGKDVKNNDTVYLNHLLIVPKADGRGIKFTSTSYVMIKGGYQIVTE